MNRFGSYLPEPRTGDYSIWDRLNSCAVATKALSASQAERLAALLNLQPELLDELPLGGK